jgi:hypothetical protein
MTAPQPNASRTQKKLIDRIKSHPRVLALDGKTEGFAEWFVELKFGWKWGGDPMCPTHGFGTPTLTQAMKGIRLALPCDCNTCEKQRRATDALAKARGETP